MFAKEALKLAFREYGLPKAIRTDNGVPFATTGRLGLSSLSVWLLRLGIEIERIAPGHPEQNGRHERMHRTLKAETTRPAKANILAQQECFDRFRDHYNQEPPHEALDMRTPSQAYAPSETSFSEQLEPLEYPTHDLTCRVGTNGHITSNQVRPGIYLGNALAGENVGLREVEDGTWIVNFMHLELGYIDRNTTVLLSQNQRPKV